MDNHNQVFVYTGNNFWFHWQLLLCTTAP